MSDLPRLLLCCFDVVPGPSATSRRLTEYVKGLSERFQVVVLSVKTPGHPHIEKYHGARLLRVPVGSGDVTAQAETFDRAVRRQLESEDYVLVHCFDPFGGSALAERRADLGYKLVYDACVFPSMELPFAAPDAPPTRRLLARTRRQELFCLMSSDAVIVGNPLTRDWVCTMGVEREQIHLLLAPVDLAPYAPDAVGRPDGATLRLVHLGSLAGAHGLSRFLAGMALAAPTTRLRLSLVGPREPQWHARLMNEAAALGLAGQVAFEGPVGHEALPQVLAQADAGVLSLEDVERNRVVGSPLSRLGEYLAAGRPVLAADIAAARQLVPAEAAVWYRPDDARSLADALGALASDVPRRLVLGAAARAASLRWDAAKVRADLVALYAAVTGRPARRALDDEESDFDANDITQLGVGLDEDADTTRLRRAHARRGEDAAPTSTPTPTPTSTPTPTPIARALPGQGGDRSVSTAPDIASPEPRPPRTSPTRPRGASLDETRGAALPDFLPAAGTARLWPLVTPVPPVPTAPDLQAGAGPLPGPRESSPLTQWPVEEQAPPPPLVPPPGPVPPPLPPSRTTRPPAPLRVEPAPPTVAPGSFGSTPTPPPLPRSSISAAQSLPARLPSESPTPAPKPAPPPSPPAGSMTPTPRPATLPSAPAAPTATPVVTGAARNPRVPSSASSAHAPTPTLGVGPLPLPPITPLPRSPSALRTNPARSSPAPVPEAPLEELPQLSDEELQALDTGIGAGPRDAAEATDEAELAADDVHAVDTDASPPPSAIDPWLAQLVHGYCPPGSHLFDRPVPPTTMPGRDA